MTAPLARALPVVLLAGLFCLLPIPRLQAEDTIRIAILADADQKNAADLLTTKLSTDPRIILVERGDIELILNEQQLALSGLTNDDALKVGKLLDAQGVVMFKTITSPDGSSLQAALISVASGAILSSINVPANPNETERLVDAINARVLAALPKFKITEKEAVKLSVVNFRPLRGDQGVETPFTRLVAAFLSDYPDFFVLERNSLQSLTHEKALSPSDSPFWTGSYLVRGTLEPDVTGNLTVHIELVPPGQDRGTVFTVTGDKSKIQELAREAAGAVANNFKQTKDPGTPSWDSTREAQMFLQEADLASRNGNPDAAWSAAYAAWSLGLREPRLGEFLTLLYLAKLGVIPDWRGSGGMTHFSPESDLMPAFYLKPLVKLASHFNYNPKYWRGWRWFSFPESLDQIDAMIESYHVFLKSVASDPVQRKINDESQLGAYVLLAASLPHILIYREPEPERYKVRLTRMAVDLRSLCHDILQSDISVDQRHQILKLQAAMLPFWSDESGDLAEAIRQIQKDYNRPNQFADHAYVECGLMTGFYLAINYAVGSGLREPFHAMKEELRNSNVPEERVFGEYMNYYSREAFAQGLQARRDSLDKLYANLEALAPEAVATPQDLGIYLQEIQELFDSEEWTNRKFQVPMFKYTYVSNEELKEGVIEHLTRQLAYKYQLFLVDHWPDNLPAFFSGDLKSPFSYWASQPMVGSIGGKPIDLTSDKTAMQEISDYYLPLIKRYHEEKASPAPNPEKLKFLTGIYQTVTRYFPTLLQEESPAPTTTPPPPFGLHDPNNPGMTAHRQWSLPLECAKLGVPYAEYARATSFQFFKGGIRLLCSIGDSANVFLEVSLPSLETKSLQIPVDKFPSGDRSARPSNFIQTDHFLYLLCTEGPILRYDYSTNEWKSLAPLTAAHGFAQDGYVYFSNAKEFYRFRPESDQLDVLASIERTPSASPFDHPEFTYLDVQKTPDGEILVSGREEQNSTEKTVYYRFNPADSRWEEKQAPTRPLPPGMPPGMMPPPGVAMPAGQTLPPGLPSTPIRPPIPAAPSSPRTSYAQIVVPDFKQPPGSPPPFGFTMSGGQLVPAMLTRFPYANMPGLDIPQPEIGARFFAGMLSLFPDPANPPQFPQGIFGIPITLEGKSQQASPFENGLPPGMGSNDNGGLVFPGKDGLLLVTGFMNLFQFGGPRSDPFTIWSVSYEDIDSYIKQHPYVPPKQP